MGSPTRTGVFADPARTHPTATRQKSPAPNHPNRAAIAFISATPWLDRYNNLRIIKSPSNVASFFDRSLTGGLFLTDEVSHENAFSKPLNRRLDARLRSVRLGWREFYSFGRGARNERSRRRLCFRMPIPEPAVST